MKGTNWQMNAETEAKKNKLDAMTARYVGMVRLLEEMGDVVERHRLEMLALGAEIEQPDPVQKKKRGRPPLERKSNGRLASGWPADAEERRAEMKRRQAKRRRNALKKGPKAYQDLTAVAKRTWANMSPAKRKARLAAMLAGRLAKKKPAVKLEAAA